MVASPNLLFMLGDAVQRLSAWTKDDLIAPLLVMVLGMALGIGLVCLLLVAHCLRHRHAQAAPPQYRLQAGDWQRSWNPHPSAFLRTPTRWLAIRGFDPAQVQSSLGLIHPTPCSWEEGLHAAQDKKLFISPPFLGWILVMGDALPDPAEDIDHCFRLVLDLSRKLGTVQFFSAHRALNHHAWAQASHGRIVRAYAWIGHTVWNQGPLSREELRLGMQCFPYLDSNPGPDFSQSAAAQANTDKVPFLAGKWSLDPTAIDPSWLKAHRGITGDFPNCIIT